MRAAESSLIMDVVRPFAFLSIVPLSLLATATAWGQDGTQPLPPLPTPASHPTPPASPPSASARSAPPPPPSDRAAGPAEGEQSPSAPGQAPPAVYASPPPPAAYPYAPPPPGAEGFATADRVHAPKYALWVGARLGLLAYGGGMYDTSADPLNPTEETVGNFVTPGLALETDVGARISRRYIPYIALELGLVGAGHRFQGTPTTAGTSFFGVGFRGLAGDVDSVSFASEISFGFRKFELSNAKAGQTWSATSFEWLRIGLGAEIRLTTHLTLSPMVTLSGGALTDTSGNIAFARGQGDGATGPLYNDGQVIGQQASYYAVVAGCGAHFDVFGR